MFAKSFWGLEKKRKWIKNTYAQGITFALCRFIQKYFVYFNLEQVKTFESESNF